MNVFVKIFLRIIAVAIGTYYAYGGLYLFENRSDITGAGLVGYYGAILGQVAVGLIFTGIGLGVISLRVGKEKW